MASRRCLVLADGFYEWRRRGKTSQPYFLQMADRRPFVFAGLWDRWTRASSVVESCTLITTSPNALVADLHDRMPVILPEEAATVWLDQDVTDAALLTSLLTPYPAEAMTATAVGPRVNSPRYDAPDCLQASPTLF